MCVVLLTHKVNNAAGIGLYVQNLSSVCIYCCGRKKGDTTIVTAEAVWHFHFQGTPLVHFNGARWYQQLDIAANFKNFFFSFPGRLYKSCETWLQYGSRVFG